MPHGIINRLGIMDCRIVVAKLTEPVSRDERPAASFKLKILCIRGLRISASINTTRAPVCVSEIAVLTAVTVFPSLGAALVTKIDLGG